MEEINLVDLRQTVLVCMFALGLLFGAISQKTHFCTMGAVADIVNFGDWGRMRQWVLAIGVAALGLQTMVLMGKANLQDTIFVTGSWSWLAAVLGGLMFGAGMVLASGCGSKTLIRLGGGNLKALYVFLVLGISSFMTLKGLFALPRVQWIEPLKLTVGDTAHLPTLLSGGNEWVLKVLMLGLPIALLVWALANRSVWTLDNLLGGLGIGLTVALSWWVIFQVAYLPEHPDTLEAAYLATTNNRAEAMSFVAPYAYTLEWLMYFSDTTRVLTTAIVLCLGVIAGSALVAVLTGQFRWEAFSTVEDMANHTVGGLLMGAGGVLALGCTVGQGLSGVSTLSLTSWLTLGFIVVGAVAAMKYQMWRMERMA